MEKLHNLKDRICDFENLMGAYREAKKNKRYRDEVLEFSFNLQENLDSIQKDLQEMTYTVGPYHEFYVKYPKPRLVMALGFRDRIVQWAIYRQINPYLDKRYINHSYGCRKEKGTLAAAQCLFNWQQLISRKADADDWYIIKGDVAKYFYRVDHAEVLRTYGNTNDDAWFMWLIGTIINNPDVPFGLPAGMKPDDCPREERLFDVGMPIGNLTSQETANIFLDRLDQYCKHVLHLHFYVRYMDDFCIFIKEKGNALKVYRLIETFLRNELHLEISPKSCIQKSVAPVEFVGFLITPHGMRLRKKTTKHIKRSVRHIVAAYEIGAITYEKAMESKICYLNMGKNCNGYNLQRWINDNFILKDENYMRNSESPPEGRHFYSIHQNENGTVDVYLSPDDDTKTVLLVKGVEPHKDLESNIRSNYDDWCKSGEVIYL